MRILTVSSLFPNHNDPKHGIFVQNRLRKLCEHYPNINASVIAPVPYFPIKSTRFPEYSKFADVASEEESFGLVVAHPRYLVIPKVGMWITPFFMAIALYFAVKKNIKRFGRPDVIDCHYFYPDGVAVAMVSRLLGIPYTCTSRGTDINLIADSLVPRKMIQWVIKHADQTIAVCQALTDRLQSLGATTPLTLRNGVDLAFFTPLSIEKRQEAKRAFLSGLECETDTKTLLLSVGWLIERKGHYLVIEALKELPHCHLLIAGNGPERKQLEQVSIAHGVEKQVTFLGSLSQTNLRKYYQIADMLVLASSREGWANVLLESMACGTPVVATNIWGTPEVVQSDVAGQLVDRSASALAIGVHRLIDTYPKHELTRAYAEKFDWQETSDAQYNIFSKIIKQG